MLSHHREQCAYCHRVNKTWLEEKSTMMKISGWKHELWLDDCEKVIKQLCEAVLNIYNSNKEFHQQLDSLVSMKKNLGRIACSVNVIKRLKPDFGKRVQISIEKIFIRYANLCLDFFRLNQISYEAKELLFELTDDMYKIHNTFSKQGFHEITAKFYEIINMKCELDPSDLRAGNKMLNSCLETLNIYRRIMGNGERELILVCDYCRKCKEHLGNRLDTLCVISALEHDDYSVMIIETSQILIKFCDDHIFSQVLTNMDAFETMATNVGKTNQEILSLLVINPDDKDMIMLLKDLLMKVELLWNNYLILFSQYAETLKMMIITTKLLNQLHDTMQDSCQHKNAYRSLKGHCLPTLDKLMDNSIFCHKRMEYHIAELMEDKNKMELIPENKYLNVQ